MKTKAHTDILNSKKKVIRKNTPAKSTRPPESPATTAAEAENTKVYPGQLIMPIGKRCLKIEHREDLHSPSLESLSRAVKFAEDRYAHFNWIIVIFDQLHDNIAAICATIKILLSGGHQGRVAVVWVGRLTCCPNFPVQNLSPGCECQLFCSAHYGKALHWLDVDEDTGGFLGDETPSLDGGGRVTSFFQSLPQRAPLPGDNSVRRS